MPTQDKNLLRILDGLSAVKEQVHKLELDHTKDMGAIKEILVHQERNLAEHMKRSDILEKEVKLLEEEIKPVLDSLRSVKILFGLFTALITVAVSIVTVLSKS